jgi:hypothetical protein
MANVDLEEGKHCITRWLPNEGVISKSKDLTKKRYLEK